MSAAHSHVLNFPDAGASGRATIPDSAVRERIHTLWDTLADFDAAKIDEALTFLQTSLCELINAQNADWIGVVRFGTTVPGDPVDGWRPPVIRVLRHNEKFLESVKEQTRNLERGIVNDVVVRMVGMSGHFRARRLCDVMSAEWFDSHPYQTYYQNCGHRDAVYVAFPVNEDAESWFGLFRAPENDNQTQPPFTVEERDTLAYALRGIKWFHRQLLLSHGLLVASVPLTHVERQVLQGLLTGLAEKKISAAQGQSHHTTHEYVTAIFRKFGVNNRAALMALWLGRAP
jgi:DNA-binding CsgD family transcriptional regulator